MLHFPAAMPSNFDDSGAEAPATGFLPRYLARIGHTLSPLEIVVANTRAGARYGEADYVDSGCGFGRERVAGLWRQRGTVQFFR